MASATPRILIAGYYGFGNTGDEAILAALRGLLVERFEAASLTVVSGNPAATAARHGVTALHWQDPLAIAEGVRDCDLVIVGGGGLFEEHWGVDPDALLTPAHWGISFYAAPALLAALEDKPLLLCGVGLGPLASEHGKRLLRAVLESASAITVRDPGSQRLAQELGAPGERVELTADLAWALDLDPRQAERTRREHALEPGPVRLGVALRPWNLGVAPGFWEGQVAAALDAFIDREGAGVVLVPFQESGHAVENDRALAERVRGRMRRSDVARVLAPLGAPQEVAAVLAGCDLVLGMRLHAMILAGLGGVPSVVLDYDEKVGRQAEALGLQHLALSLREMAGERLAALLSEGWRSRAALNDGLRSRLPVLRERARRNADVAAGILSRATTPRARSELVSVLGPLVRRQLARSATAERESQDRLRLAVSLEQVSEELRQDRLRLAVSLEQVSEELRQLRSSRAFRVASWHWGLARRLRELRTGGSAAPPLPAPAAAAANAGAAGLATSAKSVTILAFADREWGYRLQRPQLLARGLAGRGHRVYYVGPLLRPLGRPYATKRLGTGLEQVTLDGPAGHISDAFARSGTVDAACSSLEALRSGLAPGPVIALVASAAWGPLARRAAEAFGWRIAWDLEAPAAGTEAGSADPRAGDLVLAATPARAERARQLGLEVALVPNACDHAHFATLGEPPAFGPPTLACFGELRREIEPAGRVSRSGVSRAEPARNTTCGAGSSRSPSRRTRPSPEPRRGRRERSRR